MTGLDADSMVAGVQVVVTKWKGSRFRQLDFSFGGTFYMVSDANMDLTEEGVRAAGKFDTTYILFLGGTARYVF